MRKILLASVAGLGAWGVMAGAAFAQDATVTPDGTMSLAQSATTTTTTTTTTAPPMPMSSGGAVTGYSGGAFPTLAPPQPGTVVVRLNGRVRFYAGKAWDRDADSVAVNASNGNGVVNGSTLLSVASSKVNSYGFIEYGRLYPGFDGVAANGLKYGANMEIRQDAGGAAGGSRGGPSIGGQGAVRSELYFRRVWGYLGTDQLGTIRVGAIDQPDSLYMTGNFENFNDGGWDGDLPGLIVGNVAPAFPFGDGNGAWYTTNKVVYLSPSLFGFDLGASWEPTTANLSGSANCGSVGGNSLTSASGLGCDNLSSTPFNQATARRRNTFEVLVRYRGAFGPVGIAGTAAYAGGSHVQDNSGLPYNNSPFALATFANGAAVPGTANTPGSGTRYNYDGISVGDFGATATIGGLAVGGHYLVGRYNGYIGGLDPKGYPQSDAWIMGASYTFGPTIVGVQYFVSEGPGDLGNAYFGRDRREQGVAAGGTYALAPGVSIYLSALWGERKQNGYDFVNALGVGSTNPLGGTYGAAGAPNNNTVTSSAVSIGTSFAW